MMTRQFRKNVGVIGLGIIGRRICDHLRRQGYSVFVWNRSPRAVPSFVGSPAELAQMCNYLQIFVGDDDALRFVARSIVQSLTPRHVVMAHSTVSPETMKEVAAMVERRGARLVEAPFTGSKLAAEKGQLVYYVAGDEAAIREVTPLLQASSKGIVNIGEIGQASIMKVATNMVTAAIVQSAAEAMALVHQNGIDLEKFAEAMKQNGSNSATLDLKVPSMMTGDYETHFSIKHMLKDILIGSRMARNLDLDLTVANATRDRLLDEARHGHGEEDYCAMARKFLPPEDEPVDDPQGDLFSAPAAVAAEPELHEDTAFVEEQLAALEEVPAPAPEEVEAGPIIADESPLPESVAVVPLAAEPIAAAEAALEVAPPPAPALEEAPAEERTPRNFINRFLRRTDY